jgi:hypothetical protein
MTLDWRTDRTFTELVLETVNERLKVSPRSAHSSGQPDGDDILGGLRWHESKPLRRLGLSDERPVMLEHPRRGVTGSQRHSGQVLEDRQAILIGLCRRPLGAFGGIHGQYSHQKSRNSQEGHQKVVEAAGVEPASLADEPAATTCLVG